MIARKEFNILTLDYSQQKVLFWCRNGHNWCRNGHNWCRNEHNWCEKAGLFHLRGHFKYKEGPRIFVWVPKTPK
jgi:hypothetical protein